MHHKHNESSCGGLWVHAPRPDLSEEIFLKARIDHLWITLVGLQSEADGS